MKLLKENNGFTLVEVLVAMAIFAFGILAVVNMQMVATYTNLKSRHMTEGIVVAQSKIEELVSRDYVHSDLDAGAHSDVAHPLYRLDWTVVVDSPFVDTKTVNVVVSWSSKGVNFSFPIAMVKSDGS